MSDYMTTDELAAKWRCSKRAVLDAIRGNGLRATKVAGHWLIKPADVEVYEQARANITALPKRTRRPRAQRSS